MTAKKKLYQQLQILYRNVGDPSDRNIVGEQQNMPPEGQADGSLSEMEWTACRDAATALNTARQAIWTAGKLLALGGR